MWFVIILCKSVGKSSGMMVKMAIICYRIMLQMMLKKNIKYKYA